jgi:NAD(P) transhydrogenase subunit beta
MKDSVTGNLPLDYLYLIAAILFVLSLKWMSQVRSSRWGNWAGIAATSLAVLATLLFAGFDATGYAWIAGACAVGALAGVPMALLMPMTAVPQRTALSHSFGGLAVGLVGAAEYLENGAALSGITLGVLVAEMLLGFLTFTGSLIAFGKLQEIIPTRPIIYPGRNFVSLFILTTALAAGAAVVIEPGGNPQLIALVVAASLLGATLVLPIGGADMPTVIAILNSYAGLSAAAMGFVLNNKLLIVAGSLDGTSGLILSILMCRAMNRSFTNVLFGGVGQVALDSTAPAGQVRAYTPGDAMTVLEDARLVMVVPGYGMAVAQAQHAVKELAGVLDKRGTAVKYAIHPVAGRMPGHMNVLLAEADISYDALLELEEANTMFPEADVAIVLGANDVCNPAARNKSDSPLYGMPILDVDRARTVMVVKRSMNPGFAGIDNELFYLEKTMMLFGDAKKVLSEMVATTKQLH